MYCNNCGKEINDKSSYCNFCGETISFKDEEIDINKQKIINTTKVTKCPICHNQDQIAKVSAVYTRGVTETNSSGRAIGVSVPLSRDDSPSLSYIPISMSGISTSELSKKLAPPPVPTKKSFGCYKTFIIVFGLWLTFMFLGLMTQFLLGLDLNRGLEIFLAILFFSFFVITWVLISFSLKKRQKKINDDFENGLEQYKSTYPIWNRCYYCFRDDVVFDPTADDPLSASNIFQF